MATAKFILQGFTESTHGGALRWLFELLDIQKILISVAYVSEGGVEQLEAHLVQHAACATEQVGTMSGASIPIKYLRDYNAEAQEFSQLGDTFQALLDKKVDALLSPSPAFRYYAAHEGKGLVRLVGPEFDKREAGLVFPDGSGLRRKVNSALVAIREDGTYRRIYGKWFGSEQ